MADLLAIPSCSPGSRRQLNLYLDSTYLLAAVFGMGPTRMSIGQLGHMLAGSSPISPATAAIGGAPWAMH